MQEADRQFRGLAGAEVGRQGCCVGSGADHQQASQSGHHREEALYAGGVCVGIAIGASLRRCGLASAAAGSRRVTGRQQGLLSARGLTTVA